MTPAPFPDNPPVVLVRRGAHVESVHRGAWALVDSDGAVLESAGEPRASYFARSAVKSLQALPLLESGAAEAVGLQDRELALALASHNAEAQHVALAQGLLGRLGLGPSALRCGAQPPGDPQMRAALLARGEAPSALHNNCSGKHSGFLALARHLGDDPATYLAPNSQTQREVRAAIVAMTDVPDAELTTATDGCSAPTFRMPLVALGTAFARVTNPERLPPLRAAACRRMVAAVRAHPDLIAGNHKRFCTALARAADGRLFPKVGAEGVYGVGVVGADRALCVKIDDGNYRALHALVIDLLLHFGFLEADQAEALAPFRGLPLTNWAGLEVGRLEPLTPDTSPSCP